MATTIILAGIFALLIFKNYFADRNSGDNFSCKEMVLTYLFYVLLLFSFAWYTGILTSGYHFVDDHEIYTVCNDFVDIWVPY